MKRLVLYLFMIYAIPCMGQAPVGSRFTTGELIAGVSITNGLWSRIDGTNYVINLLATYPTNDWNAAYTWVNANSNILVNVVTQNTPYVTFGAITQSVAAATNYFAGSVGIGTNAPTSLLHVSESKNGDTVLRVDNNNTGTFSRSLFIAGNSVATLIMGASSPFYSYSRALGGSNAAVIYTDSATTGGLAIAARSTSGIMTFHTGGDTERIRIDSTGNVGIGTNAPATTLDVNGDTTIRGAISQNVAAETNYFAGKVGIGTSTASNVLSVLGPINVYNPSDTAWDMNALDRLVDFRAYNAFYGSEVGQTFSDSNNDVMAAIFGKFWGSGNYNDGRLAFATTSSSNLTVKMVITGAGNVGIGTVTPTKQLHVVGDTIITSNLTVTTGTKNIINLSNLDQGKLVDAGNGYMRAGVFQLCPSFNGGSYGIYYGLDYDATVPGWEFVSGTSYTNYGGNYMFDFGTASFNWASTTTNGTNGAACQSTLLTKMNLDRNGKLTTYGGYSQSGTSNNYFSGLSGFGITSPRAWIDAQGGIMTMDISTNIRAYNGIVIGTQNKTNTYSSTYGLLFESDDPAATQLQAWMHLRTGTNTTDKWLDIGCIEEGSAFRNIGLAYGGGNVGIGTNIPATLLDVNGASTIRGNATILGSLTCTNMFLSANTSYYLTNTMTIAQMQVVVNSIPKNLNGNVATVYLQGGVFTNWNSTITVNNFYGGVITFSGVDTTTGPYTNYNATISATDTLSGATAFTIIGCNCVVTFQYMNISGTNSSGNIFMNGAGGQVLVKDCYLYGLSSAVGSGIVDNSGYIRVIRCAFGNLGTSVYLQVGGYGHVQSCVWTNIIPGAGIKSSGSYIIDASGTTLGTTKYIKDSGGQVSTNGGGFF